MTGFGRLGRMAVAVAGLWLGAGPAAAQMTVYAATSGTWNSPATWTPATVPGAGDTVFIGSTAAGAASTATVSLTQNQAAGTVSLGLSSGTAGTLNLGGSVLTVGTLNLGSSAGTGAVTRAAGGAFTASSAVTVVGPTSNLQFAAADATPGLTLLGGGRATTAGVGNVSTYVTVTGSGSALTLGSDLSVSSTVSVLTGGRLDLAGHTLTAASITLSGAATTVVNPGALKTTALGTLTAQSGFQLALGASDVANALTVQSGAVVSTAVTGNVTGYAVVDGAGSRLTLGADFAPTTSTRELVVQNGATLDFGGRTVSGNSLSLGSGGATLLGVPGRGAVTVRTVNLTGLAFDLRAGDAVQELNLSGGATSTVPAGTLSRSLSVDGAGSALTLGANLALTVFLPTAGVSNGGTLNMAGFSLSADTITLSGANSALTNRGTLTASSTLNVQSGHQFTFNPADTAGGLQVVSGGRATTVAAGNISGSSSTGVLVAGSGSRLTLGAALNAGSGNTVLLVDGGTLDAQGRGITASQVTVGLPAQTGQPAPAAAALQNAGPVAANALTVQAGSQAALTAGTSVVQNQLLVQTGSTLVVGRAGGNTASLAVNNPSPAAVSILDTSVLRFDLDGNQPGVVFRWQGVHTSNPADPNDLADLIAAGRIQFTLANGATYQIGTDSSSTFILQPVPEPATALLVACGGLLAGRAARRRAAPARRPAA